MEPEAAVAIVQAGGPAGSVLLMRRAEREGDSWSGHWSLPGGRREPGDPDLLHTALRELAEECGIQLTREHVQAALKPTLARRRVGPFLLVAPFVFHVDGELAAILDPLEAVDSVWTPVDALLDPSRHALRPVPGRPASLLFPCVDMPGPPLWGFTYRLLTDWLGLGCSRLAGFDAARAVLEFLQARGLSLDSDWHESGGAQVARVKGEIPATQVLQRFSCGGHVAAVNCLEVSRKQVRMLGPEFEEYLITSETSEYPHKPQE
jgi:8-oxo-dGTP pyrophosphatase MutT (NUDIX family)